MYISFERTSDKLFPNTGRTLYAYGTCREAVTSVTTVSNIFKFPFLLIESDFLKKTLNKFNGNYPSNIVLRIGLRNNIFFSTYFSV